MPDRRSSEDTFCLIETKEGWALRVSVKPRAREFRVVVKGGNIIAHCSEEPSKRKVNKEIIKEFTKLFHVQVKLICGFPSRASRAIAHEH
jgi:uncharacterized protein YggU (UPF0235/DUF167 family)